MIAHGKQTMIEDGKAPMADWSADYHRLSCPIHWIHGTKDPIMRHDFVTEFVAKHQSEPVELVEDGANTILLAHSDICIAAMRRMAWM